MLSEQSELDEPPPFVPKRTMLPNLALFAVAMGIAGKNFAAMRIFHELFSGVVVKKTGTLKCKLVDIFLLLT